MTNQDKAIEVIRTWQARHKTELDNNTGWAAQNLAGDLANAGVLAPDLPKPKFDENGNWEECKEEPEIFVLTGGLPKRFVGIGLFNEEKDQIIVQARAIEEMRELAYALLAAANQAEGKA